MRYRSSSYIGLALLAFQLTSAIAPAQAPSGEPPAGEAHGAPADIDVDVKRGIALRRQGRDEEARDVFRDALARAPTSNRVRVQLATALQALGQWEEAQRHLQEAMQHADDPYIARHHDELSRALAYVRDRLGTVEVRGEPAGADVFVSGLHIGTLPLASKVMAMGSYTLEVRMAWYYPAIRPLTVAGRGFQRQRIELLPSPHDRAASAAPPEIESPSGVEPASAGPKWLIGVLAGAGAASGAAAGVALILRENYASRWNSDGCLSAGRTRGDNCRGDLEHGQTAGQVAIASGIAASVLLGGAAGLAWFTERSNDEDAASQSGCLLGVAGVACATTF
jgi:tetratricopeptide (TPR) repeat protein